ncbi:excalibur calcium-binding domain-containing protein [Streptomyces sp. NPDC055287]
MGRGRTRLRSQGLGGLTGWLQRSSDAATRRHGRVRHDRAVGILGAEIQESLWLRSSPNEGKARTSGDAGTGGGSASGGRSSTGGGGSAFYRNCTAVGEVGAAPIRRGDPGYGPHLDRDGVACE